MVSVMLYNYIFCMVLSMNLFVLCVACLTVFVNCQVKQFAISVGVVVVMEEFCVGVGILLDRLCMAFQRVCVLCILMLLP